MNKIIRQGNSGDSLYFIARGECDVYVYDENMYKKYTATLVNGSYFGEVALLKSSNDKTS